MKIEVRLSSEEVEAIIKRYVIETIAPDDFALRSFTRHYGEWAMTLERPSVPALPPEPE